VTYKPLYQETDFSLTGAGCPMRWTYHGSELNRGILQPRSDCPLSLEEQRPWLALLLAKVLEEPERAASLHTLFWGRLAPGEPGGPLEMSRRLALAASRSPLWDSNKGRSRSGHVNRLVVKLANQALIYGELKELFAGFGLDLIFSSAEKVTVFEARKLPYLDWLRERGVGERDRLPFDCLTWFAVSRKPR